MTDMRFALSCGRLSRISERGFTLVELIVVTAILLILTSVALRMARASVKREKERELRRDLWEMRDAIDLQGRG
jgi:general secretion pathway protein G